MCVKRARATHFKKRTGLLSIVFFPLPFFPFLETPGAAANSHSIKHHEKEEEGHQSLAHLKRRSPLSLSPTVYTKGLMHTRTAIEKGLEKGLYSLIVNHRHTHTKSSSIMCGPTHSTRERMHLYTHTHTHIHVGVHSAMVCMVVTTTATGCGVVLFLSLPYVFFIASISFSFWFSWSLSLFFLCSILTADVMCGGIGSEVTCQSREHVSGVVFVSVVWVCLGMMVGRCKGGGRRRRAEAWPR